MLLSDSQISMTPLWSYLLFKLLDYIFVTCLTKCLSWIVAVQLSPCSSVLFYIIIPLLSFSSGSVMEFWAMTQALGLKKWHINQGRRLRTTGKSPQSHSYPCCACESLASNHTLSHVKGATGGLMVGKVSLIHGLAF